jgi:hypothetical protein
MTDTKDTQHGKTAYAFVQALAAGDYASAYQLLSPEAKDDSSAADLKEQYESLSNGEPTNLIEIMDNNSAAMDEAGWVYVVVAGDDWNEAVTVTVHNNLVTTLEWGRP